jgi:hypothetical protein
MKTNMGLWIDHRKAVIVAVSSKGEKTSVIESRAERQPGRFDGVRSTTPYESLATMRNLKQNLSSGFKIKRFRCFEDRNTVSRRFQQMVDRI